MFAVPMDNKRAMVGAIHMVLILLLLLFMDQCVSSSTQHGVVDETSMNGTNIRATNVSDSVSLGPRRMLGNRRSGTPIAERNQRSAVSKHNTNTGPTPVSKGFFSTPVVVDNVPEAARPRDKVQAHESCLSSSPHCHANSTSIDPRYGVEKRLVPTGPNPLHN